jgi:3D (Asp-Asp-Asp) domain-containing protein
MKRIILSLTVGTLIGGFGLFGLINKAGADLNIPEFQGKAIKTFAMRITAYASTPDETDDTPFITANGTTVHDGVVASNILPFGTKIQIPELFGSKIFTVEDRMNRRIKNTIDVWMSNKPDATNFGVSQASVVVLGNETSSAISEAASKSRDL